MRFIGLVCITIQISENECFFLSPNETNMLQQNEIEKIGRYINGIADQNDVAWVEDFFAHGRENAGLRGHLEKDWDDVLQNTGNEDVNLKQMLDRVHHLIRAKESEKRKTIVYRINHVYSRVAALLLLPLIVAGVLYIGYMNRTLHTVADRQVHSVIHAPMGSRVSFCLPDGSKGWLNGGSSLSYLLPFSENRKVALEGEAWFDVVHNEKQPFEISAGESKIKVLGTSFNVSAYKGEKYVEVVLLNGKVEFTDESQTDKVVLKPSEKLTLQDNHIRVNLVDPSKYKGWTDGKLIFRGDNMAEVARRIERWYDVNVEMVDQDLESFTFRATFIDDSLEDVLKLLSMTSPIEYQIVPRKQLPDGTYQKEKVTLFKKQTKSNIR